MEIIVLACLILLNGVFAMSEVALLTARRTRLATAARRGDRMAAAAMRLVEEPTRFLSTVQIGITSIGLMAGIFGEAVLAEPFAVWLQTFGLEEKSSSMLSTVIVVVGLTYTSIVIGELVPKRLGQHNAEGIARLVAWPMLTLAKVSAPFVHLLSASTNAILNPLLRILRIKPQDAGPQPLSAEEIRTIVLESSNFMPKKHVSILLNLFDLESITVEDAMTPRAQIEAIDISAEPEEIRRQIATSNHTRVPIYRERLDDIIGIAHVRKVLNLSEGDEFDAETLKEAMREPYFIPMGTPLLTQLQNFQEQQDRIGLVVDEYGELKGLLTLEDILEEIIGEFTTQSPLQHTARFRREPDGSILVEGGNTLRDLNRKLGYKFPLDGPKTLNGLILEHLQDIPEPGTSVKIAGYPLEIVQTQDRVVKSVRLIPPDEGSRQMNN
jgi:Mg2+/Co2+ transporter CorB